MHMKKQEKSNTKCAHSGEIYKRQSDGASNEKKEEEVEPNREACGTSSQASNHYNADDSLDTQACDTYSQARNHSNVDDSTDDQGA